MTANIEKGFISTRHACIQTPAQNGNTASGLWL
jgi:hypothetical protein